MHLSILSEYFNLTCSVPFTEVTEQIYSVGQKTTAPYIWANYVFLD